VIKLFSVSRSPATAAAGSAVLIVMALVGVVVAAGNADGPSTASSQSASAPFNPGGPLVLPAPCAAAKAHQACGVAATKQGHAKQVKKHRVQPSLLPAPTAVPSAIATTSP
jgi:hypothetical protein